MKKGLVVYDDDKLVTRWYDPRTGKRYSQGKRVGKDCPFTPQERRIYVQEGGLALIRALRMRGLSLREAVDLFRLRRV